MSDSPASVLVHGDGDEVAVKTGEPAAAGLPVAGQDGGTARIVQVDSSGRPVVVGPGTAGVPAGGVLSVQGVPSGQAIPIAGSVTGTITTGSITGTVSANQGLQANHVNRWTVGISDGSVFMGTQENPVKVGDDFSTGEVLAQQNGANAVLVFNFSEAVQLVYVESSGDGLVCRVNPFGGTPSASAGIPCRSEIALKLPIITSTVRVYAPTGTTVNVWGFRR